MGYPKTTGESELKVDWEKKSFPHQLLHHCHQTFHQLSCIPTQEKQCLFSSSFSFFFFIIQKLLWEQLEILTCKMHAEVNPPSISSPPWRWLWRGGWQEDAHSKQCTHPAGMWSSTCTSWGHHPALSHSHWADPSSSPHAAWRPHPVHHGHSIRPPDYFITASCCLVLHCFMLPGDLTLYIMDTASGHQITSSLLHAAWWPHSVHHGHSIRAPDYFIIASCCLVTSPCTSWTQQWGTRLLHHCFMLPSYLTLYIKDTASGHQITSSLLHAAWWPHPVHHGFSIRPPDYFCGFTFYCPSIYHSFTGITPLWLWPRISTTLCFLVTQEIPDWITDKEKRDQLASPMLTNPGKAIHISRQGSMMC